MTMKTLRENGRRKFTGLAGGVALLVVGVFGGADALAGVADTKHNLGTNPQNVNASATFSGTGEICVFCHTPHAADTAAVVPLWNRNISSPPTYQTYDALGTSTLDGKTATVGSVSLACLSCHDGTQAMNSVINAPGSGLTGDATWTGGTWSGAGQDGTGKMNPARVAMLGTDLRNDHPIGIQYAGGGYSTTALTGPGADPDFIAATNAVLGAGRVWWVDTGGAGRQKTDMILYTRTNATATVASGGGTITGTQPFVECASCHDPHSSTNPTFLRTSNVGSAVCLACHIK